MGDVACTRFWGKTYKDLLRLKKFTSNALNAGIERVYVAVHEEEDSSGALSTVWPDEVTVFGVKPWGRFIAGLNALLRAAREDIAKGSNCLFTSVEIPLNEKILTTLQGQMDSRTLVVGAALTGHQYVPGFEGEAQGPENPWNTCALWSEKLWITGFFNLGEGIPNDPSSAGVEEVVTISGLQRILGVEQAQAILMEVPGLAWKTDWVDPERLKKHEAKMASKEARPASQVEWVGMSLPIVKHI